MLISLIVPSHNHTHLLPRLLDSILRQSVSKQIELIIVDDASDIPCSTVVPKYQSLGLNIRLIEFDQSRGTRKARTAGIEASSTDLIAMADADDILWAENVLERHIELIKKHDADILHFRSLSLNEKMEPVGFCHSYDPLGFDLHGNEIFSRYVQYGMPAAPTWLKICSKSLWKTVISAAANSKVSWSLEDLLLSSLLFFNAKKYIGSELVGYGYTRLARPDVSALAATEAYLILEEFIPYLRLHNCPADIIDFFIKAMHEKIAMHAGRFCNKLELEDGIIGNVDLQHDTKIDPEKLYKAIMLGNKINAAKLTNAVHSFMPFVRYAHDKPSGLD